MSVEGDLEPRDLPAAHPEAHRPRIAALPGEPLDVRAVRLLVDGENVEPVVRGLRRVRGGDGVATDERSGGDSDEGKLRVVGEQLEQRREVAALDGLVEAPLVLGQEGAGGGVHGASIPHPGRADAIGSRPMAAAPRTYAAAGVSLVTADSVVERLRTAVESTGAAGFGAFAGLFQLDDRRLLAASMDSIGTKPIVARARGALRACGADMAAHCVNDVITTGADPLFVLDYVAAAQIDLDQVAELVEGAAEVCRAAGVALVGGETAELPDVYRRDELDFAATCVGIVERDRLIDGSRVVEGDVVVGLASAGVHANGFTLVRRVLELEDYDGHDLLAPTRLYLGDVRRLRDDAHAFAHVTGGGIEGNLRRVLPAGLDVEIDWAAWERPPVFGWLARHVDEDELRRVFNLGIGYCAVVAEPGDDLVIGRVVRA
jgi:phosphoribosylformylglycinamidine cyclo-ligase